jgi:hypothetical protein
MSSNVEWPEATRRNAAIAGSGIGTRSDEEVDLRRVECFLTESLFKRILRRVFPDQRKQQRQPLPPLVGYLGTAHSSKPYELGDISLTGFCLLTDERWIPGTEMPITFKRMNLPPENDLDCFTVQATVVRCGKDGIGFSIVLCEEDSIAMYGNELRVRWVTRREMEHFLQDLKGQPASQELQERLSIAAEANIGVPTRAGARLKTAFEGGR